MKLERIPGIIGYMKLDNSKGIHNIPLHGLKSIITFEDGTKIEQTREETDKLMKFVIEDKIGKEEFMDRLIAMRI